MEWKRTADSDAFASDESSGLSKREYMATAFMAALLSNKTWNTTPIRELADFAIDGADDLLQKLEEREL